MSQGPFNLDPKTKDIIIDKPLVTWDNKEIDVEYGEDETGHDKDRNNKPEVSHAHSNVLY